MACALECLGEPAVTCRAIHQNIKIKVDAVLVQGSKDPVYGTILPEEMHFTRSAPHLGQPRVQALFADLGVRKEKAFWDVDDD